MCFSWVNTTTIKFDNRFEKKKLRKLASPQVSKAHTNKLYIFQQFTYIPIIQDNTTYLYQRFKHNIDLFFLNYCVFIKSVEYNNIIEQRHNILISIIKQVLY